MERTQIYAALKGFRGRGAIDLAALEELLVRFSQLVIEQRWIKEIDINPLQASPKSLVALDARIALHDPNTAERDLPRLAIRPYPTRYITNLTLRDPASTGVTIRPIRPEDEPLMIEFHKTLSERSVQLRYFGLLSLEQRTLHERLTRMCFIDYDREIALVADRERSNGRHEILGVGRLIKAHGRDEAEFTLLVSDQWQGKGIGTELLKLLVHIGRNENLRRITGRILRDNVAMQQVSKEIGFHLRFDDVDGDWKAEIVL
jgi:acetyltransferase